MKKTILADALIFDIDGVLLNVEKSFPEVIRQCVLRGWEKFCMGITDSEGYTHGHEWVLKRHGAFNDDYDIVWTLLSIAASGNKKHLSDAFPSPEGLAEEIKTCDGSSVAWVTRRYGNIVPRDAVRKMCSELYCSKLHLLETPMLRCDWKELPLPVGIYTGRNLTEWELAKECLRWEDFPAENVVHSDSGILKPSPKGLEMICEKLGAEHPIFFGDTASDIKAYTAFGKGSFVAIGRLLPEAGLIYNDTQEAVEKLLNFRSGR